MSLWEIIWAMVVLYFWFMFIWIFISIVGDIFRRNDISGLSKAGWLFILVALPFLGSLVYMITRPKMTEQDKQLIAEARERHRQLAGYTPAEEIAKAAELKEKGVLSGEEFEEIKRRALA
jgi:hypothetical protein